MIMVHKYFKGNARTFQVIPHQQIFIDEDKSRFQVQEELSAGDMQTGYRLPSVTDFAQLNCTERDLTDRTALPHQFLIWFRGSGFLQH